MSRSAVKSRGEKSRASSVPPPPPVQNVVDIIPGRLTENAWVAMTTQENGEEVVAELIEELESTMRNRCYQAYLQKQLVPFTASWAWDHLLQMADWLFLVRDKGEGPEIATLWGEDSEPEPCASDSWAEGCVPVKYSSVNLNTPLLQKLLDLNLAESADLWDSDTQSKPQSPTREELSDRDMTNLPMTTMVDKMKIEETDKAKKIVQEEHQPSSYQVAPYKRTQRRKQPQPSPHKALPPPLKTHKSQPTSNGSTRGQVRESQSQTNSLPQHQLCRIRDVPIARRLDPAQLPQHQVWPEVEILEPCPPQKSTGRTRGLTTLPQPNQDHPNMGKKATIALTCQQGLSKTRQKNIVPGAQWHMFQSCAHQKGLTLGFTPLSTSLSLDTMELVPGVVLGNPPVGHSGPRRENPPWIHCLPKLKPIRSSLPALLWSLDQVVSGQSPQVSTPPGPHWA